MQPTREQPHFPAVEAAGPDGVLCVGLSLAPDWMLAAYRRGIFPMPIRIEGPFASGVDSFSFGPDFPTTIA